VFQICSPDANPGQTSPQAQPSPDCAAFHQGYLAVELEGAYEHL